MSMHRTLWTLISSDKYGAKALWVVKAPWRQAHKCSLVLMSAVSAMAPCSWVLMATYKCSWMLKNIYEHIRTWHNDHWWALMSTDEHSWALLSTHKQSWALVSSLEHSWAWVMAPKALVSADKHSRAWPHDTFSTHSALAPYSLMLRNAQ